MTNEDLPTLDDTGEEVVTVLSIVVSARLSGDAELESFMRRCLENKFQIKLGFFSDFDPSLLKGQSRSLRTLVTCTVLARRYGLRQLGRDARFLLEDNYRIKLSFMRDPKTSDTTSTKGDKYERADENRGPDGQ